MAKAGQEAAAPQVAILMAVWNGAAHLDEQLQSFADQSHTNWVLLAGDDGSTDASPAILARFGQAYPVTCLDGPHAGDSAPHFMHLIRASATLAPDARWLAFSDQDDVWLPDKLTRAVAALQKTDPATPALYCSRTWVADETLTTRRLSAARPKPPGFANALVQNIAAGNTIVLNPAATVLVQAAAAEVKTVVVHDWWIYQIVTGAGGVVVHDDAPSLFYRQHGVNQIGANDTRMAQIKRLRQMLRGDFRAWNDVNIAALRASAPRLAAENRALLETFAGLRAAPLLTRLRYFGKLGLYRQSRASQAALWLAMLLGRM